MQKTRLSLAFDGLSPAFLASIFLPKPVFGHELMVYVDLKARSINLYHLSKRKIAERLGLGLVATRPLGLLPLLHHARRA